MITDLPTHIVQSKEWGKFKSKMGTKAVRVGGVQFTLHRIPGTTLNLGYCPKVNPKEINWEEIREVGVKHNCVAIRFDIPNVIKRDETDLKGIKESFLGNCIPSPKDTFAKWNVLLDISKPEEELMKNLHKKTRYNIRLAEKRGVKVREVSNQEGLETFLELNRETAKRQKFFIHPDEYYEAAFSQLRKEKMAHILVAYYEMVPLNAYMLFNDGKVLYYPYGASSDKYRNLMSANLIMWEAIKLGKKLGCKLFDMWGAAPPREENLPRRSRGVGGWWGFTRFKLGYSGEHVEFMDSYDLVLNQNMYRLFNLADRLRWMVLSLKKIL